MKAGWDTLLSLPRAARPAAGHGGDVFQNADGSYTRRLHEDPVNYQAADGTWQPIYATLVESGDGRLRQRAIDVGLELAPSADDPTLATDEPGPDSAVLVRAGFPAGRGAAIL